MTQFRRRKSFGPFRFTLSQRGLSESIGWGPFRLSLGADRKVRRTLRIPDTGVYDVETLHTRHRRSGNRGQEGVVLGASASRSPRRRRRVAALLQLVFGWCGAGRFYIGSHRVGAAQAGLTLLGCLLAQVPSNPVETLAGALLLGVWVWAWADAVRLLLGHLSEAPFGR